MLSERRKADRQKMADQLIAAMVAAGAEAKIDAEWLEMFPRQIMIRIEAPGGAYIGVDFDGESCQPDVHVCTWNTNGPVFLNPDVLGDVNPFHYGKVNRVACGLDQLITWLEGDVAAFIDGVGYLSHDDHRIVAMAERYAQKGWSDPRHPRNPWKDAA
jgi:hypothetical protein